MRRNKSNNKVLKMVLFIVAVVIGLGLLVFGVSKIKPDEFHKASIIFVVDSSASNMKDIDEQKATLQQLCSMLDPEDHIKILRVSEKSYIIYEGSPQATTQIRNALKEFTKFDKEEYGTAYGLAIKKAFNHSLSLYKDGYNPAVVVMGDLENEGKLENQIHWDTFPAEVAEVKKQTDDKLAMMFLYAAPDKLDYVKEKLGPVLGEKQLIVGNKMDAKKKLNNFLPAIGR